MSTQLLTFRQCQQSDLNAVKRLMHDLYASDPHLINTEANLDLTFAELNKHPEKGRIIVFDQDGGVVGYAIVIHFWSNEYKGNILEIDELCVASNQRSKGLASKFIAWLETESSDTATGLSLQVAHSNERAADLYERLGFKLSRNRHLLKMLGDKPSLSLPTVALSNSIV